MSKKIIITEEQFQQILNEELGIAKEVPKASKELKKELFTRIENNHSGEFNFLDILVKYNVYSFENETDFLDWFDSTYDYVNGYSYDDKTLYLTIIQIAGDYNVASINDTIQHELEHYYQTKMAGHNFTNSAYDNAVKKMNEYNAYIKHISRIEYYSNHIEIDAFVNGAYYAVQDMNITDYDTFIESTDLQRVRDSLKDAYNFFISANFSGLFFNEMLEFIKRNGYYNNCVNLNELRNKICDKCQKAYSYFVRKSSRAYALIQNENCEKNKVNSQMNYEKLMHYRKNE